MICVHVVSRSVLSLSELNLVAFAGGEDFFKDDLSLVVFNLALTEVTHSGEGGSELLLKLVEMDESLDEFGALNLGHVSDTDAFFSEAVEITSAVIELTLEMLASGFKLVARAFEFSDPDDEVTVLLFPTVALFLPSVQLLREEVASLFKTLALGSPFNDDSFVTVALAFEIMDLDDESTVLVFPLVALLLPHDYVLFKVVASALNNLVLGLPFGDDVVMSFDRMFEFRDPDEEFTVFVFPLLAPLGPGNAVLFKVMASFLKNLVLGLPVGDDVVMLGDGDLKLLDGLHVDGNLSIEVVVFALHSVELLLPHVAVFLHMMVLLLPHVAFLLDVDEFLLHVEKGIVVLLELVVFLLQFSEVGLALSKGMLSHGILVSVHVLELLELLALSL
jgi:hypothetical protein